LIAVKDGCFAVAKRGLKPLRPLRFSAVESAGIPFAQLPDLFTGGGVQSSLEITGSLLIEVRGQFRIPHA